MSRVFDMLDKFPPWINPEPPKAPVGVTLRYFCALCFNLPGSSDCIDAFARDLV